ncbi:hypothetical protein JNB_06414 [Janibacter sp. HTCC2649]|uniref:RDD family protein n=1 Tax=Janibacter sp. HTCC2649 TaxID=313589 RepID=UPI0000670CC3|nr:RDD family protein [Janibacter sp. HTCC2649]EAP99780.1 hypothetical protein JNB_06414 [Janibacter sp. HTCC2649]
MSTPSSAGWYENPDNPEELRYFDGILWTKNTTPLRKRPHQGPPVVPPSSGPQERPAGWGPQPHSQTGPPEPRSTWLGQSGRTGLSGVPGQPVLASYGLRVVAYILDAIIVGVLALVFGGVLLWRAVEPAMDGFDKAMTSGDIEAMNAALTDVRLGYLVAFLAVQLILFLVYQVFCLVRWSATPGKLTVGISVRRLDRPGPLDIDTALRRAGFQAAVQAMGNLPYVSLLGTVALVADLVWPLADDKNQAIHDKVARTIVVKGKVQR